MCAKGAEEQARATRFVAEKAIARLIEGPEVGQKTETLEDGTKIIVKRGLKYTADLPEIKTVMFSLNEQIGKPVEVPIAVKTTQTLDLKLYEWYRKNTPAVFELISKYVSVAPVKDAITVKVPIVGKING